MSFTKEQTEGYFVHTFLMKGNMKDQERTFKDKRRGYNFVGIEQECEVKEKKE